MKRFFIFLIVFLFFGICFLSAHDLIILRNGNIIEAQVMEISPKYIRYKRSEHLDGLTFVIPIANVLSIRYENGTLESIAVPPVSAQINKQAERTQNTALDTNKFIFGINANLGGFIPVFSNPSINIELSQGNFLSEINLIFPYYEAFGFLFTFNRFWHSQIGGAYLGGGIGWIISPSYHLLFALTGLNVGYKFITDSGLYFRTGAFLGFLFPEGLFIKPDLAIGWTMR